MPTVLHRLSISLRLQYPKCMQLALQLLSGRGFTVYIAQVWGGTGDIPLANPSPRVSKRFAVLPTARAVQEAISKYGMCTHSSQTEFHSKH